MTDSVHHDSVDHQLLTRACTRWQQSTHDGSSPLRGAARVLLDVSHYFTAPYIDEYEDRARASVEMLDEARVLLHALEIAERRDADGWNDATGLPRRGFAGRGLKAKPGEDPQIEAALQTGTLHMPLWGVSLDEHIASSFGADSLRWVFKIAGPFPAIPAWTVSGIKEHEQELICGGRYDVVDLSVTNGSTHVRLRFRP